MEYEAEGPGQEEDHRRHRTELVEKDCQARKLNKKDAMDRSRRRKLIKLPDVQDGREWVNVSSGTGPTR